MADSRDGVPPLAEAAAMRGRASRERVQRGGESVLYRTRARALTRIRGRDLLETSVIIRVIRG